MVMIFWDANGMLLVDFLENQRTVTGAYYEVVLKKLRDALLKHHPGKVYTVMNETYIVMTFCMTRFAVLTYQIFNMFKKFSATFERIWLFFKINISCI